MNEIKEFLSDSVGRIIVIVVAVLLLIFAAIFIFPNIEIGHKFPKSVEQLQEVPEFDENLISGCYSECIFSTKNNSALTSKIVYLKTLSKYEDYLNKYKNIYYVWPVENTGGSAKTMYQRDMVGVVITSKVADPTKQLEASYKYIDDDGRLYVALTQKDIPSGWVLSTEIEKCRQVSTIIFLTQEEAKSTNSIATFLVDSEVA